jgi:hypothetical protein
MTVYSFTMELGSEELGRLAAVCPHCHTRQMLSRRELRGNAAGLATATEALVCPHCGGTSRNEGRATRVGSAMALVPFALLLGVAFATGLYLAISMASSSSFSGAFAGIAACLIAVAGYFEYRTVRAMRRLLARNELVPLDKGLLTSM